MQSCVRNNIPLSTSCASCFVEGGKWGAGKCKCLDRWCSKSCLGCALRYSKKLEKCTGLTQEKIPQAKVCHGIYTSTELNFKSFSFPDTYGSMRDTQLYKRSPFFSSGFSVAFNFFRHSLHAIQGSQ